MRLLTLSCTAVLAAVLPPSGQSLSIDYSTERVLTIASETNFEVETTTEITRDGEPMEGRGGGGQNSTIARKVLQTDRVLAVEDGLPTHVRRSFETIEGSGTSSFGEMEREFENETPLDGVTLELTMEDGEVEVEVVDGDEPDDDAILEGHTLESAFHDILPGDEVEEGDQWELDAGAIRRALGADVDAALFAAPIREEPEGGGRGGRGGGRRGGGGRQGGGLGLLGEADWTGTATLVSTDEEHDGQACVRIKLECTAAGQLEEPEREPGGGGRRGRSFSTGLIAQPLVALPLATDYDLDLEGSLLFSAESGRPLLFEVEGTITIERNTERSRGESTMTINSISEGSFEISVEVTETQLPKGDEDQ